MANGAIKLQNSLGADLYPITPIDNVIVSSGTTATAKRTSVRATTSADNYHFPTEYAVALVSSALSSSINTKQATISAGYGIVLSGATVNNNAATVADVMGGTAQKMVDGKALMGALTLGQAVDVTSIPDGYTSSTYNENSLNVTTTSVGFAAFPKWAADLDYIMVADFVNSGTTSRTITPSGGTWLEGGSAAKTLPANTTSRMAMVFSGTSASHPAKFVLTGTGVLHADMLREYEVTKCTKEARDQLVALNTKNDYESYYTVKDDMVDPWTYIINMGASPATTVAAGLAYQINAMTGSHTLTCNACPPGYVGRETFVRILLGSTGNVIVQTPLVLGTPLIANSINNCSVIYRDGQAILTVTDNLGGYIVTNTLTSGDGSLSAALTATGETNQFVMFDYQTVGSACPTGTAAAAGSKYIIGNGLTDTTITGTLNCGGNKITMHTLGLSAFTATSGTVAMRDVYIPNGATASMGTNGLFSIERLTGDSGTLYIGPTSDSVTNAENFEITGIKVTGYTATGTGIRGALQGSNGILKNCELTGNRQTYGVVVAATNNNIELIDTVISGNTGTYPLYIYNGVMSFSGCTINNRVGMQSGGSAVFKGSNYVTAAVGQGLDSGGSGCIVLTTDAVVDITGNTVTNPLQAGSAGNIQFASGGATILYSSGSGSASYMMDNVTLPAEAKLTTTNMIDLGGTGLVCSTGSSMTASGVVITAGYASYGGGIYVNTGAATLSGCIIASCVAANDGGAMRVTNGSVTLTDCQIVSNTASRYTGGIVLFGATTSATLTRCQFSANTGTLANDLYVSTGAVAELTDCALRQVRVTGGTLTLVETNRINSVAGSDGLVNLTSGATLDLTGNTSGSAYVVSGATVGTIPINPGGGIVIGSNVQIYPSAGSASAIDISGGTYTAITNGGVLMGPMYATNGETLSGNATIDLQKTVLTIASRTTVNVSGLTFLNGSGVAGALNISGYASATIVDCNFVSCGGTNAARGILYWASNGAIVSNCSFSGGYGGTNRAGYIYVQNTSAYVISCNFMDAYALLLDRGAKVFVSGNTLTNITVCSNNSITFTGSNWLKGKLDALAATTYGNVYITDGAIVDLTSNTNTTPIMPGSSGSIIVSGSCTIINSAGVSVSLAGGTYKSINKDGTTTT